MKISDILYFAPNIPFSQVDLTGDRLPQQYAERVEGYYLAPAEVLVDGGHGFAAGLLVVTAIDALARVSRVEPGVGERIKAWLSTEVTGLYKPQHVDALYRRVRNGLVHEARLKNGTEFSLDQESLVYEEDGILAFNPRLLLGEVRDALDRSRRQLENDTRARQAFLESVKAEFAYELRDITGRSA